MTRVTSRSERLLQSVRVRLRFASTHIIRFSSCSLCTILKNTVRVRLRFDQNSVKPVCKTPVRFDSLVTPLNIKFYKHDTRVLKYHKREIDKSELCVVSYFCCECTIFLRRLSPPKSSSWDPPLATRPINRFFRKIFEATSGLLKCARGSLSDPWVSGSPSLSYSITSFKNGITKHTWAYT